MIALLRSDAYRVLHGRWIWVTVAIVTFLTLVPALLMRWTNMGPVAFDSITGSALSLGGVEILAAVMAAIVCCDKTDLGFGRSVLSSLSRRGRVTWFAEKCVFSVLLAAVTLLLALALGLLALPVTGVPILGARARLAGRRLVWVQLARELDLRRAHRARGAPHAQRDRDHGLCGAGVRGILEGGIVIGIDALCYLAGGASWTSPRLSPRGCPRRS